MPHKKAKKLVKTVSKAASNAKYGLVGVGVSAIKRAVASKKLVKAKRRPPSKRQPPGGAYSTAGQRPKKKAPAGGSRK